MDGRSLPHPVVLAGMANVAVTDRALAELWIKAYRDDRGFTRTVRMGGQRVPSSPKWSRGTILSTASRTVYSASSAHVSCQCLSP